MQIFLKMGNVLVHGYFNTNIDGDSAIPKTISLCLMSIALILQCSIGFTAIHKMKQHSKSKGSPVNILFVSSFTLAVLYTIHCIIGKALGLDPIRTFWFFLYGSMGLFYWSLLVTFIVRLYITFKDSVYRMSRKMIVLFVFIIVLGAEVMIALSACTAMELHKTEQYFALLATLFSSVVILYLIGSVLAVHFFVSSLLKLTADRDASPLSPLSAVAARSIELDEHQQKMSDLSGKYSMLFAISISSTTLVSLFISSINKDSGLKLAFWTWDMCVNLWCLYLQFSFAADHYTRCCGWCDQRSRNCAGRRTKRVIRRYFTLKMKERKEVADNEATPLDENLSESSVNGNGNQDAHELS